MTILLDGLLALLIGALAGLGVGSGGILIVYLTAVDGMNQLAAQGLNLATFVFALGAALLVHLHRRKLSLPILLFILVFGAAGAFCGSLLAHAVKTELLRLGLGGLLLLMGTVALFRK
ncbi:MAG: TSUP family transporter [Clostridia bacterium]|nr:TSUP family transporter [Clostridia bacterium]